MATIWDATELESVKESVVVGSPTNEAAGKLRREETSLIDTNGLAWRMVISERVALAFEREPLGRKLMSLIPVQIAGCGAIGSDGEHLYFDPELVRNLPRQDFKNRLMALAETLADTQHGSPRDGFAPWTGVLLDGVVRRDEPSARTLETLKRFDKFMARDAHECGWNYDIANPPKYLRMVVTKGILRHGGRPDCSPD